MLFFLALYFILLILVKLFSHQARSSFKNLLQLHKLYAHDS